MWDDTNYKRIWRTQAARRVFWARLVSVHLNLVQEQKMATEKTGSAQTWHDTCNPLRKLRQEVELGRQKI